MKIYKEIEQRSDEWFFVRRLKMTASNASTILANGKGLETYCKDLVCEYLSNEPTESFTNSDIERGILLEPTAREQVNEIYGLNFDEVGFVELDKNVGVSPDGVIYNEKGDIEKICELKCPNNKRFVEQLISGEIPKEYISQMQMQLMVTGAKECIYLAYNQNIKPYVFTKIIKPDEVMQKKLQEGIKKGKEIINNYLMEYFRAIEEQANEMQVQCES